MERWEFPVTAAQIRFSMKDYVTSLLDARRPGFALPGAFFSDERVFAADLAQIFARHWLFVASEPEIPEAGDYRTCPYHRWAYDTTGHVVDCGQTGDAAVAAGLRLKPVNLKQLDGLLFVCVSDEPPEDFDDMAAQMTPYLAPHSLPRAKLAKQIDLIEHGNWKLTIENNRECFHCGGHPELLNSLFHFLGDISGESLSEPERIIYRRYEAARELSVAAWDRAEVPWQRIEKLHGRATGFRTERLVLEGDGESMTLDTRVACSKLLGSFTERRLGTLHLHVQPNAWFHFLSDHIVTFCVLPLDHERTLVRTTWLVDADAEEGKDYDVENLTRVWVATNNQDAQFVAETQRGTSSPEYVPGPLSATEFMVDLFHRWYDERMRAGLKV